MTMLRSKQLSDTCISLVNTEHLKFAGERSDAKQQQSDDITFHSTLEDRLTKLSESLSIVLQLYSNVGLSSKIYIHSVDIERSYVQALVTGQSFFCHFCRNLKKWISVVVVGVAVAIAIRSPRRVAAAVATAAATLMMMMVVT